MAAIPLRGLEDFNRVPVFQEKSGSRYKLFLILDPPGSIFFGIAGRPDQFFWQNPELPESSRQRKTGAVKYVPGIRVITRIPGTYFTPLFRAKTKIAGLQHDLFYDPWQLLGLFYAGARIRDSDRIYDKYLWIGRYLPS